MIIKVFITVEVEKHDIKEGGMSQEGFIKLMDLVDFLRLEGIPVQYKSTSIPRRSKFVRALTDIEKI